MSVKDVKAMMRLYLIIFLASNKLPMGMKLFFHANGKLFNFNFRWSLLRAVVAVNTCYTCLCTYPGAEIQVIVDSLIKVYIVLDGPTFALIVTILVRKLQTTTV